MEDELGLDVVLDAGGRGERRDRMSERMSDRRGGGGSCACHGSDKGAMSRKRVVMGLAALGVGAVVFRALVR